MIDQDTQDLYQEVILDHYRNPRNFCELECATHSAKGNNPLCGDKLQVYLKLKDGKIDDLSFKGAGCAISQASASLMTEQLKGRTVEEALETFEKVHCMLTGKHPEELNQELESANRHGAIDCLGLVWCMRIPHACQMRVACLAYP